MVDLDELIADTESAMDDREDDDRTGWFWAGRLLGGLESVRVERDAALARNAKQREAMKRMKVQRRSNGRRAQQAEARIAEAAKLHQCFEMPNGFRWCSGCSTDEYPEDWPCPTAVALGLNEGENE